MLFISILFTYVNALNLADYPTPMQKPPGNPTWTSTFLKDANIPNIPINSSPAKMPNHGDDIAACPARDDWGITYDDGPSQYTTSVREHLQSLNVKATFFVIGSNVIKHPEQLLAIHKDGHQIGIHTWSHTPLTTLSNDQIISEVVWTAKAIKEVTGVTPRYVRCPEGDIDNRVRAVLKAMGLRIVWWNRDSKDYTLISSPSAAAGIERVFQQWASEGKQGTISLQHDIHPLAVEKSGPTLKTVANAGYKIKTIASCLNDANPYSDSLLSRLNLNTVVTTTIPVITTTINSQTQSTTTTLPPVANIKDPIVTGTNQSPTPTAKPNSASLQSWNHLIISISIIFYALYF